MDDLENAFEKLKCAKEIVDDVSKDYFGFENFQRLQCACGYIGETINMLKAQEPRVMTLDEVKNLPAGTDVWIQHAGNFADDVIRAATVSEVTNASISFLFGGSLYYMNYGEKPYGWICWTARPTNEQREKVKWE